MKLDANWAKDPSGELEETEYQIDDSKGKIAELEAELKELKAEQESARKIFDDYRKKYPVGQ